MQLLTALPVHPPFQNSVVTIGTFDGVHNGHRQIIERLNRLAASIGGQSVVVTFDPHPRQVLSADTSISLLSPANEKFALLEQYGVQYTVVVPFTRAFAQQTPEQYVRDFLVQNFRPHAIVIGYDHRFGQNRQGDLQLLKTLSSDYHFEVEEIPKHLVDDVAVSSTRIRQALAKGEVATAAQLLGYAYPLTGTVERGQQLGRTIGYPTANLGSVHPQKLIPAQGVYAVRVRGNGWTKNGMLSIGTRTTIGDNLPQTIEVNIFDFSGDLYGQTLTLEFMDFLRPEERFDSLEALTEQLHRDKQLAEALLK